MKNLFLSILLACGMVASVAQADTAISAEESAVIMNSDFQKVLELLRVRALQQGESLKIESFTALDIPPDNKYIYTNIVSKVSADFNAPFVAIGSIVAGIKYGPMGEVIIDSVYFAPVAAPPKH